MGYILKKCIVVILLSCIYTLHISIGKESVKWIVTTTPIKFGDSVSLRCIVTENTCPENYVRRWTGGPLQTLLALNYKSSNTQKYEMYSIYNSTSFELVIYDFNENDIECKYSCSCGFEQFSKNLSLHNNEYEIIYPIEKWTKNLTAILKDHQLSLQFSIAKVYPIPKCRLKLDDIVTVPNMTFAENYTDDQLLPRVTFTANITVNDQKCSALLIVECLNQTHATFLSVMKRKVKIAEKCNVLDSFHTWNIVSLAVTVVCCTIGFGLFAKFLWQSVKKLLLAGLDKAKEKHSLL